MRYRVFLAAAVLLTAASRAHADPASPAQPASPPSSASPAETATDANLQEARIHFGRGVQLYRDRDFRGALAEFKRAYAIGPSFRILYNIGQSQLEVQDYAGALDTFARYLKGGGDEVPAEKREEVAEILTRYRERIAEVTVHASQPGAEIFVDDVSVGREPLSAPITVSAGRHRVSASADGLPVAARIVEVAGGDHAAVELAFASAVIVGQGPARVEPRSLLGPPAPLSVSPPPGRTPFWLSLGVTGALGVATLTGGLLALSAKRNLDSELGKFPTDQAAVRGARQGVTTTAILTDVLGAATLVGVGVTTYFAVTTFKSPNKPSVGLGVGPGSIVAQGQFR